MRHSQLPVENKRQDFIDLFGGYNHNIRIQENEFYDMENLSSDGYPTLSPRKKRGIPSVMPKDSPTSNGIMYKGDLYTVVGTGNVLHLYINDGYRISLNTTDVADETERHLIMMGAYIVILPDKQYFNTANKFDYGYIEKSYTTPAESIVTVVPCHLDGIPYSIDGVKDSAPENAWDGYVWLDTSSQPATMKEFTATNSTWVPISTTYVRVTSSGIGKTFNVGDGIEISGFVNEDTKKLNKNTIVQNILDDDNIVVTGMLDTIPNRFTFEVNRRVFGSVNTDFYCDESITSNELAGKEIIIDGKRYLCKSNSKSTQAVEYKTDINVDDPESWLQKDDATLTVKEDVVDSKIIPLECRGKGLNEELLKDSYVVMLGCDGDINYVTTNNVITDGAILAYASITLYNPVRYLKKGTTIYPVKSYKSTSLFTTSIVTEETLDLLRGDGACLALEHIWKQAEPITITRCMPELDFVIESNNRLWGCRYGIDNKGNFVNQIYASALGDFKNWSVFAGTSADSYFATVGTSGEFTGAINYMGYPVFFKDDCIHTVYGAYPAQYQINTSIARGVQKGCNKSLVVANEVLYYKSRDGIMAYAGSLPTCISAKLGNECYKDAVCTAFRNKLYISMRDFSDDYSLFVYDVEYGTWYKENGISAVQMLATDNDVYYLDNESKMKSLFGSGTKDEEEVEWFAKTGLLGMDRVNKKYISRVNIRIHLDYKSTATFYIKYGAESDWYRIKTIKGHGRIESVVIPIIPKRSDYFRIKMSGKGNMNIYSISKTIEEGSDL